MLERQTRELGVALAGLLIGLPGAPAMATVMEFGEEGAMKVRPSLNYLQRAKLLAREGAARAGTGAGAIVDTGWTEPDNDPEPPMIAVALPEVIESADDHDTALTAPAPAIEHRPEPEWIEVDLAALPTAFVGADLSDVLPPAEDDTPDTPDIDEALSEEEGEETILETRSGSGIPPIPPEAITLIRPVKTPQRRHDEEAGEQLFPHLDAEPLAQIAGEIAEANDIPPALFVALIEAESGFDVDAISVKGAVGLTQLMPATAEELGVDPEDPVQNMRGGARYLAVQYKRFGAWDLALAAYNAGPSRVARLGGIPDFPVTRAFIARVLGNASRAPLRLAGAF